MSDIVDRIEREIGIPGLVSVLADRLSATDQQSLLLEVYRHRSRRRGPSEVLERYQSDRFVRPSSVSPTRLLAWDQVAYATLPNDFEALALSPVAPLGTCSAVAAVDQNWAIATARNTEVVSDSTNLLALECAVRRRVSLRGHDQAAESVHLAASHRLVRTQHYDQPHFSSHFSAFALCSAGRDVGHLEFELTTLRRHAEFYLTCLRTFLGPALSLRFTLTDFGSGASRSLLEGRLISPIAAKFAGIECAFDDNRTSGRGYYRDLCFHIVATTAGGEHVQLADGGSVDWTQRLLSDVKERLMISGIGSERVCSAFDSAQ